jgi:hypothetical protein
MQQKQFYTLPLVVLVMAIVQRCTLLQPTDLYAGLGEQNAVSLCHFISREETMTIFTTNRTVS